mmetsp:Transcript_43673/g.70963  ORF Transcript_43673/g.70963 Transcript_43673/m.70963 type:complete len:995 (+) Transcript_43673:181-3165(+)
MTALEKILVEGNFDGDTARKYATLFAEQDIRLSEFLCLNRDLFRELGIHQIGHHIRLMNIIQRYKEKPVPLSPREDLTFSGSFVDIRGCSVPLSTHAPSLPSTACVLRKDEEPVSRQLVSKEPSTPSDAGHPILLSPLDSETESPNSHCSSPASHHSSSADRLDTSTHKDELPSTDNLRSQTSNEQNVGKAHAAPEVDMQENVVISMASKAFEGNASAKSSDSDIAVDKVRLDSSGKGVPANASSSVSKEEKALSPVALDRKDSDGAPSIAHDQLDESISSTDVVTPPATGSTISSFSSKDSHSDLSPSANPPSPRLEQVLPSQPCEGKCTESPSEKQIGSGKAHSQETEGSLGSSAKVVHTPDRPSSPPSEAPCLRNEETTEDADPEVDYGEDDTEDAEAGDVEQSPQDPPEKDDDDVHTPQGSQADETEDAEREEWTPAEEDTEEANEEVSGEAENTTGHANGVTDGAEDDDDGQRSACSEKSKDVEHADSLSRKECEEEEENDDRESVSERAALKNDAASDIPARQQLSRCPQSRGKSFDVAYNPDAPLPPRHEDDLRMDTYSDLVDVFLKTVPQGDRTKIERAVDLIETELFRLFMGVNAGAASYIKRTDEIIRFLPMDHNKHLCQLLVNGEMLTKNFIRNRLKNKDTDYPSKSPPFQTAWKKEDSHRYPNRQARHFPPPRLSPDGRHPVSWRDRHDRQEEHRDGGGRFDSSHAGGNLRDLGSRRRSPMLRNNNNSNARNEQAHQQRAQVHETESSRSGSRDEPQQRTRDREDRWHQTHSSSSGGKRNVPDQHRQDPNMGGREKERGGGVDCVRDLRDDRYRREEPDKKRVRLSPRSQPRPDNIRCDRRSDLTPDKTDAVQGEKKSQPPCAANGRKRDIESDDKAQVQPSDDGSAQKRSRFDSVEIDSTDPFSQALSQVQLPNPNVRRAQGDRSPGKSGVVYRKVLPQQRVCHFCQTPNNRYSLESDAASGLPCLRFVCTSCKRTWVRAL